MTANLQKPLAVYSCKSYGPKFEGTMISDRCTCRLVEVLTMGVQLGVLLSSRSRHRHRRPADYLVGILTSGSLSANKAHNITNIDVHVYCAYKNLLTIILTLLTRALKTKRESSFFSVHRCIFRLTCS